MEWNGIEPAGRRRPQSKLRRVREYEAEDLELRRATASGLWNKNMHPDASMDTEEKAEIRKLTDALKGQVSEALARPAPDAPSSGKVEIRGFFARASFSSARDFRCSLSALIRFQSPDQLSKHQALFGRSMYYVCRSSLAPC